MGRGQKTLMLFLEMTENVFHDDNRIIDDESYGSRNPSERHNVERLIHRVQQECGDRDRDGDDDGCNKNYPPVPEKDEEDQNCKKNPHPDTVADSCEGFADDV